MRYFFFRTANRTLPECTPIPVPRLPRTVVLSTTGRIPISRARLSLRPLTAFLAVLGTAVALSPIASPAHHEKTVAPWTLLQSAISSHARSHDLDDP